jgi:metal-responsive CopG/Arc/MetJ family transcriptional regulator
VIEKMNGKRVHRPPFCHQIHPNIPDDLLKELDDLVERKYGGNRTEAVRDALRQLVKGASNE